MNDITLETRDGFDLAVTIEPDQDSGAPWDNSDGHGPVTDWTTSSKSPGQLVLARGLRAGRSKRFYNWQEACALALRDEWGVSPYSLTIDASTRNPGMYQATAHHFDSDNHLAAITSDWCDCPNMARAQTYAMHRATMSPRAYAALAASQDFARLKSWCDDQWNYVGIIVTASRAGIELASASLWGIESDSADYLTECANELAQEAMTDAQAAIAALME